MECIKRAGMYKLSWDTPKIYIKIIIHIKIWYQSILFNNWVIIWRQQIRLIHWCHHLSVSEMAHHPISPNRTFISDLSKWVFLLHSPTSFSPCWPVFFFIFWSENWVGFCDKAKRNASLWPTQGSELRRSATGQFRWFVPNMSYHTQRLYVRAQHQRICHKRVEFKD